MMARYNIILFALICNVALGENVRRRNWRNTNNIIEVEGVADEFERQLTLMENEVQEETNAYWTRFLQQSASFASEEETSFQMLQLRVKKEKIDEKAVETSP